MIAVVLTYLTKLMITHFQHLQEPSGLGLGVPPGLVTGVA